jgi:hypothetical protein
MAYVHLTRNKDQPIGKYVKLRVIAQEGKLAKLAQTSACTANIARACRRRTFEEDNIVWRTQLGADSARRRRCNLLGVRERCRCGRPFTRSHLTPCYRTHFPLFALPEKTAVDPRPPEYNALDEEALNKQECDLFSELAYPLQQSWE